MSNVSLKHELFTLRKVVVVVVAHKWDKAVQRRLLSEHASGGVVPVALRWEAPGMGWQAEEPWDGKGRVAVGAG